MKSNYPIKRLIDVAPLVNRRVRPFDGELDYLATGDITFDSIVDSTPVTYTNRPSRADLLLETGDIAFARMKETVKVFQASNGDADRYIISTGFAVHSPNPDILDSGYFKCFCLTDYFQKAKDKLCSGATQKAITNDGIANLTIPIPYPDKPVKSLAEQRRIAGILDKADAIRKQRRESLALADEFLKSTFLDMFGDPVTNSKGWDQFSLADYGKVTTGNTPSRKIPGYYGNFIEWIKSDNINTRAHFITKATEGLSENGFDVCRWVPGGSTLVTCIAGSPSCIGNCALTDRKVAFNQQINAITPFKENDSLFLYMLIYLSKKAIQQSSTNSMKGMVSKTQFSSVQTIKVPPDKQKSFGNVIRKLFHTYRTLDNAAEEADNLFNSLVQRAFKGELS